MADLNGDGRFDALVYARQLGNWWVARSAGDHFERDGFLRADLGVALDDQLLVPLVSDIG